MADQIELKILLDNGDVVKGFVDIENKAKKTSKTIGDSFEKSNDGTNSLSLGIGKVSKGLSSLAAHPAVLVALAIAAAAKATFEFAQSGEKVNAINAQFAAVAKSASLSADQFSESIIKATSGLIDDEDALQIATKGIISLGENASKIPKILEASRSVSKTLGKDFKDTFEDLSTFVESGNAKILRNYGIILDLDKAYSNAAKSIGLVTADLTEQQKQTIRTNLILEEVPKKFNSISQSVTPLSDAFKRLTVSAGNSIESLSSKFAEFLAQKFIDNSDLSNVSLTRINNNLKEVGASITNLNARISEIKSDKLGSKSVQAASELQDLNSQLKKAKENYDNLFAEASGRSDQELFKQLDQLNAAPAAAEKLKLTSEQIKKINDERLKNEQDLTSFLSTENQKRLQGNIQYNDILVKESTNSSDKLKALNESIAIQEKLDLEQKNQQISAIQEKYRQKNLTDSVFEKQSLQAIEDNYEQQRILSKKRREEELKVVRDQAAFDSLSNFEKIGAGFTAMSEGFDDAARSFSMSAVASFKEVGKQAFNTLGRGIGQAFAAFGQALASGEDAGKAFLNSLLGIFADIAIQLGTSYILQGIAASANPLTPGIGGPLIAAGAALATFGGVLKGISGGQSKSSSSASADSGGGIAANPSPVTEITQPNDLTKTEPGTQVQVVVQGSIYDSDETGSRIVDLINTAFDKKGVVVNQGAFA